MPALVLDRCVFLHVPKTGGTWATTALRRQGVVRATILSPEGKTHPTLAMVRRVTDLPVIAAVRDPAEWLRSFWRFFYARNWRPATDEHEMFVPLLEMATPSYAEFAGRYLNRRRGYISELLAQFADGAEFVCRQESLASDLAEALKSFEQPFIPAVLEEMPPENVSRRFAAACAPEIEAEIRAADRWLMETFYARAA